MSRIYSHSALDTFRTCPRQFQFQYVDRVKVPRVHTADTFLGRAVHRVLAKLYKLAADGAVMPLDEAVALYLAEWQKAEARTIKVLNEHLTVDDYIANGRAMLETYYERNQPFNQGTLLGAELNITYPLADTSFRIRAIIDRLWKRPDGVIEIIDYKTGKRLPQGGHDPRFYYQMGIYQLAVETKWPDFKEIELAQHFLKMDEVIRYRMRPDELDEFVEDIRTTIIHTLDSEKSGDFPTSESGLCDYCDFYDLCPAKRHQRILEDEENLGDDARASMEVASELAQKYIETDDKMKSLKAEHAALKEDIIRTAADLDVTKITAPAGDVTIRQSHTEKFITKTEDAGAFANLSSLTRQWELDEYFKLDGRALMTNMYKKRRFTPEQVEKLKPFVIEKDEARVTIRKAKGEEE